MLVYEHDRTSSIVTRLVAIARMIRTIVIAASVITLGVIFTLAAFVIQKDIWWAGAIVGAGLGFIAGWYASMLITTLTEWLAQVLVAQGEIVAALKKNG